LDLTYISSMNPLVKIFPKCYKYSCFCQNFNKYVNAIELHTKVID